ncbi:hypothetical protein HF521_016674 [Silurus meridionalis]|uniref:Little elongation complex subunit 1 C-terminal domain-containing protein n=1 Tax=Silurus meridionalis TaxID=175797 RepID=A0A8T0BS02_SILME|nr:hypothetical protein HF521_016674 [Silurus meridionalis]
MDYFSGDFLDKNLIQFTCLEIIERELHEVACLWNCHRIRPSRNAVSPSGRPLMMYTLPRLFGTTDYLKTEPPEPIYSTIASTLKALLEDSSLTFQKNSWFGDDLCPAAWDYIFSLDLLCAQLGWTWTFTNIIRNEIWLILDTLLLQTRSEQTPYRDVSEAAVFRLLGRLGQLGLKENQTVSVRNLLKGIHTFLNQKLSKDMPWEVQLAMVYATHDLAPCNPKDTLKTLESWRQKIRQPVPPAVTKCLKQIGFLCHQNY